MSFYYPVASLPLACPATPSRLVLGDSESDFELGMSETSAKLPSLMLDRRTTLDRTSRD